MNTTIRMKSIASLATAAALALAVVAPVQSQQPKAAGKQVTIEGVGVMELTRVTASIEAVDLANRIVTLRGPRGNVFAVLVGPEVKNLPQVKVGDVLEIDHYESVADHFAALAAAGYAELDCVWRNWMWGIVTARRPDAPAA